MTEKQRFIKALKRERFAGHVPHFELVFNLTMESLGRVHPCSRNYNQWDQMSSAEQNLHINDLADLYIAIARKYHHSAILVGPANNAFDNNLDITRRLLERIREKSGNEFFLMRHGDVTTGIPTGTTMHEFSVMMYEEPEKIKEQQERNIEYRAGMARELDKQGHLLDGFALCADLCFNTNSFFPPDIFADLVAPYLKKIVNIYREMGYYSIKHTDGNVMPILEQIVDCAPDAVHSLDPQGGIDLREVKRLYGDRVTLCGNVNCGLLQTGTDEEVAADVRRSLRDGMEGGTGYIFCTSNSVYPGMPLYRFEMMHDIWRAEGIWQTSR